MMVDKEGIEMLPVPVNKDERWYVRLPPSREVQAMRITDVTPATVEMCLVDRFWHRARHLRKDVEFIERVEQAT